MIIAIGFTCMISLTVAANLLMKMGAMTATSDALVAGLVNWRTVLGLACFGAAGLLYAWLLKYVPLHVAQSFAAIQYIAVIFASAIVLADSISSLHWLGVALIATGVVLIGSTA